MFIFRLWIVSVLLITLPLSIEGEDLSLSYNLGKCNPSFPPLPIAYGEIYTVGTVIQAAITTPTQLTTFNMDGLFSETIPDSTLDQIAILNSGDYLVSLSLSIEGTTGRIWTFQVAVNGVAEPNLDVKMATTGTSTDTTSGAAFGLLSLSAGDVITVLVSQNQAGAATLEMESANLNVIRLQ